MAKTYKVWIEIEEYDEETEDGETLDAPGAYLAEFATYEQAWDFAERLTAAGECLADRPDNLRLQPKGDQR